MSPDQLKSTLGSSPTSTPPPASKWIAFLHNPVVQTICAILAVSIALTTLILGQRSCTIPTNGTDPPSPQSAPTSGPDPTPTGPDPTPAGQREDITITAGTDFSQIIVGRTVSVVESVESPDPIRIVADDLRFSRGAVLRAPEIWIFADTISGATLNVSAVVTASAVRDGADAGTIYMLASGIESVDIRATGGDGEPGSQGAAGGPGRRGRCDGFGAWRPAQAGGNGAPGQRGGNGGNGGGVRVVYGESYEPGGVGVDAGRGASGGPGGPGGPGGDGCVGLGGAQSSAASGSPGSPGPNGSNGNPGTIVALEKAEDVRAILSWLRERPVTDEGLRFVIAEELDDRVP